MPSRQPFTELVRNPKCEIEETLNAGYDVIIEKDIQGSGPFAFVILMPYYICTSSFNGGTKASHRARNRKP